MSKKKAVWDPPPKEPTLEQHMIEFGKVTAASLNSAIGPNKKYLILQGNKIAQIFIKNAFEFFEKHFPNKNPHLLTARCLQINVSAVRRFKKGPTEKTICQKPYTKKSKEEDNPPKSKQPRNKKVSESNKTENKLDPPENSVVLPTKLSCIQQNIGYQPPKDNVPEQAFTKDDRDFNQLQASIFPPQNNDYLYTTGKNMNFSEQNICVATIGTLVKPTVPDIFHLSPEPQYGAPSIAVATNINQKTNLTPTQVLSNNYQDRKSFSNQHSEYQYPNLHVSDSTVTVAKEQTSDIMQKQFNQNDGKDNIFDQSKFNFGSIPNNQSEYKY